MHRKEVEELLNDVRVLRAIADGLLTTAIDHALRSAMSHSEIMKALGHDDE